MGSILCEERVDDRMAELTSALAHNGAPDPSKQRLCARCGRHRGHGHKWCEGCRTGGRKEYNQGYHQRNYVPKSRAQVSAARRGAIAKRWRHDA
jgi:hypothetical protein